MKRVLVCLFMVLSLMLAPMMHATGMGCPDTGCTLADQTSQGKKQSDGKLAEANHCCCQQIAEDALLTITDTSQEISFALIIGEQTNLASITVGPLLEPPSHA